MSHLIAHSPGEPAKSHALRVFEVSLGVLIGALLLKLASAEELFSLRARAC